jgi:hypothetical protein
MPLILIVLLPRRKRNKRLDSGRNSAFFGRRAPICQALCAAAAPPPHGWPRDYGKCATIRETLMERCPTGRQADYQQLGKWRFKT